MKLKVHEHNKNNLKIVSKTKILLLLLIAGTMGYGQRTVATSAAVAANPKRIKLSYDAAGNQTSRVICLCSARMANPETIKDEKTVTDKDMEQSDIEKVSYYPNPVKEELYVKWENTFENPINQITIYSITGQLLKSYENLNSLTTTTLFFSEYPTGYYEVVLNYQNGEKKNLNIVKN